MKTNDLEFSLMLGIFVACTCIGLGVMYATGIIAEAFVIKYF